MERDSFVFYRSFFEAVSEVNKKDQTAILLAVCDYALNGVEPKLSGVPAAMFSLMKPNLDANQKKFENGKKGGRPKTEKKPNNNQSGTNDLKKQKPSDNQSGTEKEPNYNPMSNEDEDVDEDVNEDEDVEGKTTPSTPSDLVRGYQFSPALEAKVLDWLDYKAEKRDQYKPTGLKALLTEIKNNAIRHGETEVIALISQCMAANWKGIIFDRLGQSALQKKGINAPPSMEYSGDRVQKDMYRLDKLLGG